MPFWTLLIIALSLSIDTFAVSVTCGTGRTSHRLTLAQSAKIASILAIFQATMPVIGWIGGKNILSYIEAYDHWVVMLLLGAVGLKMVIESFKDEEQRHFSPLDNRVIVTMAFATSIDALAIGIGFAIFKISILTAFLTIGMVTFLTSLIGIHFGKQVGSRFGRRVEIIGGLTLIGIGIKIVAEHLYG